MWARRGNARLVVLSSVNTNSEYMAYRSFRPETLSPRGARKATTWITGLWQPSVHRGVAF